MSDHIPVSEEKRIMEKAQPSQLPLQGTAPEPAKSRRVVLAHLAAAKRTVEGFFGGWAVLPLDWHSRIQCPP